MALSALYLLLHAKHTAATTSHDAGEHRACPAGIGLNSRLILLVRVVLAAEKP